MPRQKKVVPYQPSVKMPLPDNAGTFLQKADAQWLDFDYVYQFAASMPDEKHDCRYYLNNLRDRINAGTLEKSQWIKDWRAKRIYKGLWGSTEQFKVLNAQFLQEYATRADLQEVYGEAFTSSWYYYDLSGKAYNRDEAVAKGWDKSPESYIMYHTVISHSTSARQKIELNRPTSFQAGDMVLLRPSSIGRDVDPYRVSYYSQAYREGKRTPDESVQRIGTIISVTDTVGDWRGSRGSKLLKIFWVGAENHVNVEEKHLKWYMRPTFKNGLKVREE